MQTVSDYNIIDEKRATLRHAQGTIVVELTLTSLVTLSKTES
jgi:hypothetical protein